MAIQNIEVINPISKDDFYRGHFLTRKPVVIRDYFKGQSISNINTMDDVAKTFQDLDVVVCEEYVSRLTREKNLNPKMLHWKLQDYMQLIEKERDTKLCIREQATPAAVAAHYTIPNYCEIRPFGELETNLFIANSNNVSKLHFDADHRSTLLYQVAGRKTVVLIPSEQSKKVSPMFNFSWLFIESMSPADRKAFLNYVNAYEHVLMPGEMIFIPMMMWHQLEYTDTGMSVNFRFGRNEVGEFMAKKIHPDLYSQNLACKFHPLDKLEGSYLEALNLLKAVVNQTDISPFEKYSKVKELCKTFYSDFCKDAIQDDYYANYDEELIEKIPYLNQCACYPYN